MSLNVRQAGSYFVALWRCGQELRFSEIHMRLEGFRTQNRSVGPMELLKMSDLGAAQGVPTKRMRYV